MSEQIFHDSPADTAHRARWWSSRILIYTILIVWAMASGLAAEPAEGPVSAGRFSVISDAGGAVWAFQPGGELIPIET